MPTSLMSSTWGLYGKLGMDNRVVGVFRAGRWDDASIILRATARLVISGGSSKVLPSAIWLLPKPRLELKGRWAMFSTIPCFYACLVCRSISNSGFFDHLSRVFLMSCFAFYFQV